MADWLETDDITFAVLERRQKSTTLKVKPFIAAVFERHESSVPWTSELNSLPRLFAHFEARGELADLSQASRQVAIAYSRALK